jgi:RHS repeat-associated protein
MEANYTGTLAEGITTTMYDPTRGYDKNGNIGYLKRITQAGSLMDRLIYTYNTNNANQLIAVNEQDNLSDATKGFKDKINTTDYTYDTAGNMVTDANKDLSIAYNHLNLPAAITRTNSGTNNGLIKHYYAGATKIRMETYDAAGTTLIKAYDYLAGMVYQETVVASVSTKTLDFIASPEGRAIPKAKVNPADAATTGDQMKFEYSLKDHLGNLRVSCRCGEPSRDQAGTIIPTGQPGAGIDAVAVVQEQHYDAWGLAFNAGTVSSSEVKNRKDKFTYNGKELLTDLDLGWNDYGARMYDASIGRWSAVDRFAEKYNPMSPFQYGVNNPILMIDINGDSTFATMNKNGTYNVVGGNLEGNDNGIYIKNSDGSANMIGYSATPESFYNSESKEWMGNINLNDQSGRNFLNKKIISDNPGLLEYILNAKGNEPLDFKRTNGTDEVVYTDVKDHYRGMPLSLKGDDGTKPVFASARDVGNIGAGLVAGRNGYGWETSRLAFDALQSYQEGRFTTETTSTKYSQKLGHRIGFQMYLKYQASRYPGNAHFMHINISNNIIKKEKF